MTTTAPALERPGDLISLLVALEVPTVVFVDEIHQLSSQVEELLYSAMEDGKIDMVIAEGTMRAKTVSLPLAPFCLVGATTQLGRLGGPFRDRFGYIGRLKPYDTPTLTAITLRSAGLLDMRGLTEEAAEIIASRSRGTPRLANRHLRRVRDWVHSTGKSVGDTIDKKEAIKALEAFGVDEVGLDSVDRELLTALCVHFHGGPVGVSTLAAAVGEATSTIEETHEPYLMRAGLLARTPRGRMATRAAYKHLDLPIPAHLEDPTITDPGLTLDL
jgi:Holliday junction DNA helicase RuvB